MKKFTKILCVFFIFSSIVYSQTYEAKNFTNENGETTNSRTKIYEIGTGLSFNYFHENLGLIVDSYHFFNAFNNQSDKLLFRFGMGFNYSLANPTNSKGKFINSFPVGAIITGSLGYVYLLNDINIRGLKEFGAGFSIDYSYISSTSSINLEGNVASIQTAGLTLQFVLNHYLIGLGTGAVFDVQSGTLPLASPYARVSFGITF